MQYRIVIINGSGRSGKDTFCQLCRPYVDAYRNVSSITPIVDMARIIGYSGNKSESDRLFLSNLKQLVEDYNEGTSNYVFNQIQDFLEMTKLIQVDAKLLLFIHIREPKQIDKVCQKYPQCKTCLIVNRNVPIILSNDSDKNVSDYSYDYVIDNSDSIEVLKVKAKSFISDLYE